MIKDFYPDRYHLLVEIDKNSESNSESIYRRGYVRNSISSIMKPNSHIIFKYNKSKMIDDDYILIDFPDDFVAIYKENNV